jgi:hypothetical protein
MRVFVAFDGDTIGQMIGRARQADDVEGVRRVNQRIELGNEIWRAWATNSGGSVIEIGGDEGAIEVPADKLDELPAIRAQYAQKVEASVSVGVGMKLSEASKALLAAKLSGKDRITFYTEECDKLIEDAQKHAKDEEGKIADEYLNKAAPAMNAGAGAGFAGATRPSGPTIAAPSPTQGEHSQGQAIHDLVDGESAPAAPEATHAAADFERQLHDEAWKGHEQDIQGDVQSKQNIEQVKGAVAQALVMLKQQAPVLEQLKQGAPQAYAAMMQLAQAVIAITRELTPQQIQKSEDSLSAGGEPMAKALRAPKPSEREELVHYSTTPGLHQVDVEHMGSGAPAAEYRQGKPEVPRAYYYRAGSKPEPIVTQGAKAVYRAQLDVKKQKLYDLGADAEGLRAPSREKFLAGEGLNSPEDTLLDAVKAKGYYGYYNSSSTMPHVVALFHAHPVHELDPVRKDEELGKTSWNVKMRRRYQFAPGAAAPTTYGETAHASSNPAFNKKPVPLTDAQVDARRETYARSLGLDPISTKPESRREPRVATHGNFPNAEGSNELPYDSSFDAAHETAHAMMTPDDKLLSDYQNWLTARADKPEVPEYSDDNDVQAEQDDQFNEDVADYDEGAHHENVANQMETHIDRRAGVDPHMYQSKYRSQLRGYDEESKPYDPKSGTVPSSPVAARVVSGRKIPFADAGIRAEAREHVQGFDEGKSFTPTGRTLYPAGVDAAINARGKEPTGTAKYLKPARAGHIERLSNEQHNAAVTRKDEMKADPDQPASGPELEKGALPMPKASAHHVVVLPVGSTVDNKVKVQHQDGKTSWKQMGAGAIRSMDPAGHPTSSRSPNSK